MRSFVTSVLAAFAEAVRVKTKVGCANIAFDAELYSDAVYCYQITEKWSNNDQVYIPLPEPECKCQTERELACYEEDGWWVTGERTDEGWIEFNEGSEVCELPSQAEIECVKKFGVWETWYEADHVGSGRWRVIGRQEGTCVELEENDQ